MESFGKNAVQFHNNQLSVQAGEEIAKIWGTETLSTDKRCLCFMNNVRVPSTDMKICGEIAHEMLS